MVGRPLFFAGVILSSAISAGCLLDAGPYGTESGGGSTGTSTGAGGSGAGTSTSTSSTTGGGGTTTTTTTTTAPDCMMPSDCGAPAECKTEDCVDGKCVEGNQPANTFLSNDVATDCLQKVCDGHGVAIDAPADSEIPIPDGDVCHSLACANGIITPVPKNAGTPCGAEPPEFCVTSQCVDGQCMNVNLVNGTYILPPCGTITCTDGGSSALGFDSGLCDDANPNNCKLPECGPDGGGYPVCYGVNAPENMSCIKQNTGFGGTCNSSGHCCNGGGCD